MPRTGSMINNIMAGATGAPTVGMGGTRLMWTDRKAGTIVEVSPDGKTIVWQQDKATRVGPVTMSDSQSYTYEPDPDGEKITYTLRKNGRYINKGGNLRSGEVLAIGYRREYYDYGF